MNTVNSNVIKYLEYIGCGTFGTDLFFGRVPKSNDVPTAVWWIAPITARREKANVTGENVITYDYDLYYRDTKMKTVDEKIFAATREIVKNRCYSLNNFQTMSIDFGSSIQGNEIDQENRVIGRIGFAVQVYDIPNETT